MSTFIVDFIIHSLHVSKFAYNREQLEFQTATFVNERQSEHLVFCGGGRDVEGGGDTIAA